MITGTTTERRPHTSCSTRMTKWGYHSPESFSYHQLLRVLRWMEEILHHLHTLFRLHIQATTPHPLFNFDDRSLGAVQDLCHWNDKVKKPVFIAMLTRGRGVQDFLHPQSPERGLALARPWLSYMAWGYFQTGLSFWLSPTDTRNSPELTHAT